MNIEIEINNRNGVNNLNTQTRKLNTLRKTTLVNMKIIPLSPF